jgi:hypothetical protein
MEAIAKRITEPLAGAFFEKRFHQRFEVKNATIATSRFTVVGHIMDLSEVGLAFRYVASRECSRDEHTLSILVNDHTFKLNGISFKVVWDVAVPEHYSLGPIAMRYCGIEFRNLKDRQRFALRYFIQNHTTVDSET